MADVSNGEDFLTAVGNALWWNGDPIITNNQKTVTLQGNFTGNGGALTNVYSIQATNLVSGVSVTNPSIVINNGPSFMVSNNSTAWGEIVSVDGISTASSDIAAQADKGTALTNYLNLGINNSAYAQASSPLGQPFDTYLVSAGQNMFLDVIGTGKSLYVTSQTATNSAVATNIIMNASGLTVPNGLLLTGNGGGLTNLNSMVYFVNTTTTNANFLLVTSPNLYTIWKTNSANLLYLIGNGTTNTVPGIAMVTVSIVGSTFIINY
jgi:hypothetical protein